MIEISVTGNVATLETSINQLPVLTSGSQNIYSVDITTDDTWEGLTTKAVFVAAKPGCAIVSLRPSDCIWATEPINGSKATITEDSVKILRPGYTLYIGITGSNGDDGDIVRNSTFAQIGTINQGAEPISFGGDAPVGYWDLVNRVADLERYNLVLSSQDDLNTLVTPGTYLFETESVPSNTAFGNKSIVTVTTAQNLGYTTVLQFQQRVGTNTDQYIAFRNRTTSGTWSPWYYPIITSSHTDADTTLVYRGALTATDDLNMLTTNGMYYYSDSNIPLHAPCDYGGIIIVSGSNSSTSQKSQHFVGYGSEKNRSEAHREMAGSTWFNWRYVPYSKTTTGYVDCGKRISIVGDSISTFAGYVPTGEGYAAYYSGSNGGVKSVNETWWKRLIDETGMILCVNNSVSGSCCCSGIRTDRVEASNPTRTGGLADSDGNKPDIIIVYMGMNDYVNAAGQGTYNGTGEFPTDTSTFREAYSIMLNQIMTNYPMAKVYCCTLQHTASKSTTKRSVDYTTDGTLKRDWNNIIRELAQLFNCEIIDFESCGINAANIPYYTGDDNTDEDGTSGEGTLGRGLHPNAAGHELLYYEALKHFRKDWQI